MFLLLILIFNFSLMKKIAAILTIASLALLASCGKDVKVEETRNGGAAITTDDTKVNVASGTQAVITTDDSTDSVVVDTANSGAVMVDTTDTTTVTAQ